MFKLKPLLIIVSDVLTHAVYGQRLNKRRQISMASELMEMYHPDAMRMLQKLSGLPNQFKVGNLTYRSSPPTDPSQWLEGKSELDLLGSMNTMIHESHHGFTSSYYLKLLEDNLPEDFDEESTYRSFYLSEREIILVRLDELYNSHELKNDIPKRLRTFRYDPYIVPRDRYLSSQVSSIYGLMNEFNAYYQGTLMTMQMYPEYLSRSKRNIKTLQSFVQHIGHSYGAFFEFKYFTLMYLKRAEAEHPAAYKASLKNMALREVYTKVHIRYEELINTFDTLLLKTVDDLNNSGIKSEIRDGFFWIEGYGVGIMNEDSKKLIEALNNPKLQGLHQEFLLESKR